MTKPTINTFTQMGDLLIQKYERYLPTAFDESLSLLQKVNKIINYLDEMGLLLNDVVNQWNEVMEWVLNEGISESVNNKLDEMVLDGTLSQIINIEIIGSLSDLQTTNKNNLVSAINENASSLTQKTNDLLQRAVNVKQPPYNAKGDGVTDDRSAIWSAIQYCNDNQRPLYFPKGTYLINSTIDFTSLPYVVDSVAPDYKYRITIIGEDVTNTTFKAGAGLSNMFVYNPTNKNNLRSFTFKNIKIIPTDSYDDLNIRAPLKAFELLASPYTHFENIEFIGIDSGIHLQSCWMSTFSNILGTRMRKGIFLDGTNPNIANDYGFADHCIFNNILFGGALNDYGIYLLGTRATKITKFNSEQGYTGNAIKIEGCHNVEIDTIYLENYISAKPILIKGNTLLNSITDFSTNIKIKNAHVYNLEVEFLELGKGVDGVTIGNTRFTFNYDTINHGGTPTTKQRNDLILFTSPLAQGLGNYFKNISILDNNDFYDIGNFNRHFAIGWSQMFIFGNHSYVKGSNISYYAPSYRKGITVVQLDNTLDYTSFFVEEEGSYGTLTSVTGTVSLGNNVVTLSDVTNIIPGTYLNVGDVQRVKVMSKNPSTKQIVISKNASVSVVDGVVSYADPVLRYNYKARSGSARPTGLVRGEYFYDTTLGKPIWWTGSVWVDSSGATV